VSMSGFREELVMIFTCFLCFLPALLGAVRPGCFYELADIDALASLNLAGKALTFTFF